MSNEKSNFGGIFSKLGKLVFTEEYINENKTEEATNVEPSSSPTVPKPTTNATAPSSYTSTNAGNPDKSMLDKVHALVESMNKPGIDFFELWNAAEAMGGITETNVSGAYVALKIASGNTLTKQVILNTGEGYCTELKSALDKDINDKINQKNKLNDAKNSSRNLLSTEITDLNNKIVELQNLLKEKNQKLLNIDADFDPKIKEIDDKITNGKVAVDAVVAEMKNVLAIATKIIQN
jgi:hypothetical protein